MNEKGSVTIAVIALMPFLLATAAVIFASYLLLIADAQARHVCRTELLQAQADIKRILDQLYALNLKARLLRLRREAAQAKAAATVGTPAHPAALAELQAVIQAQMAFALKQKKWIAMAQTRARLAPFATLSKVRKVIRERQTLFGEKTPDDDWRTTRKTARIDLQKIPAHSLTPDYKPGFRFQVSQEMRVGWSYSINSLLPSWLQPFAKASGLRMSAGCAATLIEENKNWRPQLTREDRRSLSFL